ncbi:MAG: sigma 54-interacting transcriptional regulator, partial [Chloroflexota bacterium]
ADRSIRKYSPVMRPTDYPYDHDAMLHRWHTFKTELMPQPDLDPLVMASWVRCAAHFAGGIPRINMRPQSPRWYQQHPTDVITLALPYLEDIFQVNPGSVVFLTDEHGEVLALEGALEPFQSIGLQPGEQWAEFAAGTNAVGLALQAAMPVQVLGAEHYFQIYHTCGTSAAPIHNAEGDIVGCIGILTSVAETAASLLAVVMATARAISNQLQTTVVIEQAQARLKQMNNILESLNDGVITWDVDGTVQHVNSMACQILGTRRAAMMGQPVTATLDLSPYMQEAIRGQQALSDVETRFHIDDRIVQCMMSIQPIPGSNGEIIGGVAMLRPLSQVRSLVNQQAGSSPTLTFADFEFESAVMRRVLREAQAAARGSLPVLLIGEGGAGKSVLAQAVHNASPRGNKPFIVVNCRTIPNETMRRELLGTEGSNGTPGKPGKLELADGGTLLLDQIDELSLEGQTIVLQMMTSRHVLRQYANRPTPVNVRIIATSAIELDGAVEDGHFLPQLFYLFNVFTLRMPPLRERPEDVPLLLERFLRHHAPEGMTYHYEPDVLNTLRRYPFPGNVRELESVIERGVVQADGPIIRVHDLPDTVQTNHSLRPESAIPQPTLSLEEAEREAIIRAGWAHGGAIVDMATVLGINRSTLWRKMKQFGLRADDFK